MLFAIIVPTLNAADLWSTWIEALKSQSQDKTTDYYAPEYERCIRWNDSGLVIDWQYTDDPLISEKDAKETSFKEAGSFE